MAAALSNAASSAAWIMQSGVLKSARKALAQQLREADAMIDRVGGHAPPATQFDDGEAKLARADG